ncbi:MULTISPECIES: penicillin-binding transpeptidase domain-containing protein [unclassified Streptomyces]|uniref:penicillin-binding transpeptidase domain-containing protein n=1 Tax=unclassified Streptomyces TaxID=2593676 RepID=UPI0016610C9B|nr:MULTISPECIES: penicillin-binding transpeptidase domain-containing protein [unclassified Streptomyces]MBD0711949.1 penicillin-binding protein [Streptomyces sp. CBMA291]MBD0713289.1 penicillin-binding protein [Streptomyces sp. CBMA370]
MTHLSSPPDGASWNAPTQHRKGRRRGRRAGIAVAVAAVVGACGYYAFGPARAGRDDTPDPAATAAARGFLADWAGGRLDSAGARTTDPAKAREVLRNFTVGLDIGKPVLTPGQVTKRDDDTVRVAFAAKMPVTGLGTWAYRSELPVRKQKDGSWKVDWSLSLVHPRLSDSAKFRLEREEETEPRVDDRNGKPLTAGAHPSLGPVLDRLAGGGSGPRGAIRLVDRHSGEIEGTETTFGAKEEPRSDKPVATTFDATWQAAADQAMAEAAEGRNASLVALRVDNGEVLALANSPSTGFNRAFSGTYAPGSTWKIVTSSALLLKDAVKPDDVVDCPKFLTVGKEFHNVETSEFPGATFRQDFMKSCNTAFISLRDKLGDTELGDVARDYFGVGQEWKVGIPSYDGSVPEPTDQTEKAASMIGQGRIQANPLVMASVTATAVSGTFHQPTVVPGAGNKVPTKPLPAKVSSRLRELMRATVTDGTAHVLADLPGGIGAKTGTAEVAEDDPNNGWMVAWRGNVAVACVVEQGVTGGGSAGPILHSLLKAVPGDPA